MKTRKARMTEAGLLLGTGLGGLLNGIVLQQLAQLHHMLSARVPPETLDALRQNLAADGRFNLVPWIIAFAGLLALLRAARQSGLAPSTRAFFGLMLAGWGTFNLVEGAVYHHVLRLHHVHDLPAFNEIYDWWYLAIGIAFILLGIALRDGKHDVPAGERRSGHDRRAVYGWRPLRPDVKE
jgi:uncharacterized membrane protein